MIIQLSFKGSLSCLLANLQKLCKDSWGSSENRRALHNSKYELLNSTPCVFICLNGSSIIEFKHCLRCLSDWNFLHDLCRRLKNLFNYIKTLPPWWPLPQVHFANNLLKTAYQTFLTKFKTMKIINIHLIPLISCLWVFKQGPQAF